MTYYIADVLVFAALNAVIVLGLNLQYGYAGILNLTYYSFVAIGAYVTAVTTMGPHPVGFGTESYVLGWTWPWPLAILASGLVAAAAGLLIMLVLIRQLRSDYFGIVTISLGFIFWEVINNDPRIVDGANGLFGIPQIPGTESFTDIQYSLVILLIAGVILLLSYLAARAIFHSPYGRMLRAAREDEIVTLSFGKNVTVARTGIFLLGCFMAGVAGAVLVLYLTAWSPAAFLPIETFFFLAAVIIGGSGNYNGSLLGTVVILTVLDEITRFLPTFGHPEDVGAVRAIVIGVALILVLRFMPGGLLRERAAHFYAPSGFVSGLGAILPRRRT